MEIIESQTRADFKTEIKKSKQLRIFVLLCLFNLFPPYPLFDSIRRTLLGFIGFKVSKKARILSPLQISIRTLPENIVMGNVFINSGGRISIAGASKLVIGNEVLIGPQVMIEKCQSWIKVCPRIE